MALTNAEKQKRHRSKRLATLRRYEKALRMIADMCVDGKPRGSLPYSIARTALGIDVDSQ